MVRIGSFKQSKGFDEVRIKGMVRATTQDGLDKLVNMVRHNIYYSVSTNMNRRQHKKNSSVNTGPGSLYRSVRKSIINKNIATGASYGTVYSRKEYARAYEYGQDPRIIKPSGRYGGGGKKLAFERNQGTAIATEIKWPGSRAFRPFGKAATAFEQTFVEPIAKKNAAKYLGAK